MSLLRYQATVTWVDRTVSLGAFLLALGLACLFDYLQMPILTGFFMLLSLGGALANEDSKSLTLASLGLWLFAACSFLGFSPLATVQVALAGIY
jgi:hypothetical protein